MAAQNRVPVVYPAQPAYPAVYAAPAYYPAAPAPPVVYATAPAYPGRPGISAGVEGAMLGALAGVSIF